MEQVKKPSPFGRPTQRQRGGTQPQALSLAVVIDHALKVVELFGLSELTTTRVASIGCLDPSGLSLCVRQR